MTLSDILSILYKWRKVIIVNIIIAIIISTTITLLIPKKYRAVATVILAPQDSGGGLGNIANLFSGGNSLLSMSAKMLGGGGGNEDMFLGILNSRTPLEASIHKYNLIDYYRIKNRNIDRTIKAFKKDIYSDINEFGFIEVGVLNKNPNLSAEIANFLIHYADSLNIVFNIKAAKRNREYIEKRYLKNIVDLKVAEDELFRFQKENNIYAIPEQIQLAIGAVSELEVELFKNEILLDVMKEQTSVKSSPYRNIELKIDALKDKLKEINQKPDANNKSMLFIPFEEMGDLEKEYLRKFREMKIQNMMLEFTYPLYEQAKMEEQKAFPTIMTLDKAIPPMLKYSPKRAVLVVGIVFIVFMISTLICLRGEFVISSQCRNPVEIFERNIFSKLIEVYRI